MLAARIDEMRDHLDEAGIRLRAAETQLRASGNSGGYVKFTLSKEMMPDSFNGTDRMKFSDWEFKMSNFLSAGDYEHAGDIMAWITQEHDVDEDKFDRVAAQRGWVGQARDHARFARYLFTVVSNRSDGTPHRLERNGRHMQCEPEHFFMSMYNVIAWGEKGIQKEVNTIHRHLRNMLVNSLAVIGLSWGLDQQRTGNRKSLSAWGGKKNT